MKMRKLDQILEQCLEDMELNESKLDFHALDRLCEDALSEGAGAGKSVSFEIEDSMINGYAAELNEEDGYYTAEVGKTTFEGYYATAETEQGGIIKITKAPIEEKLNEIISKSNFFLDDEPYTGQILKELNGLSGSLSIVYGGGWIQSHIIDEIELDEADCYVEFVLTSEDGKYLQVDWENNEYKDLFYDVHTSESAYTSGIMIPVEDIKYYPSDEMKQEYEYVFFQKEDEEEE